MARIFDIREPSLAALREAPVYFRYGSNRRRVLVDASTARAVVAVYDAVNKDNQAKMERMIAGSSDQFARLVAFCWTKVSFA